MKPKRNPTHSHSTTIIGLGILIALAWLVAMVWWPIVKIRELMK